MTLFLHRPPNVPLSGRIRLDGSKSISNRVLILRALSGQNFPIEGLSTSKDTVTLRALLDQFKRGDFATPFDAGAAGTTFRFMTAFLSQRAGTQMLTGSERMKQRPVGPLVDALRHLGADITYLEKEGYPPLRIGPPTNTTETEVSISANTSSQYISALLMLGAFRPQGLRLQLRGEVVSRPYILMTLRMLRYFGLGYEWEGDTITVPPAELKPRPFRVEADWSAASYHYALVSLQQGAELYLDGLSPDSLQGDSVLDKMMVHFGVQTEFTDTGIHIWRPGPIPEAVFEWDFVECPDLAQTLAVICTATGTEGLFTGLQTLRIKETDRIAALQNELAKVQAAMRPDPGDWFRISGKARVAGTPAFDTYEDHRMAMAFAPLAMLGKIGIREPGVVEKSYPKFWEDLLSLGFRQGPEV